MKHGAVSVQPILVDALLKRFTIVSLDFEIRTGYYVRTGGQGCRIKLGQAIRRQQEITIQEKKVVSFRKASAIISRGTCARMRLTHY